MVTVTTGDIFESDAQTLVNTVNCVGVMGKGIARGFKDRFPDMYRDYVKRCEAGMVRLGEPYLFPRLTPPSILNFPTKHHWRSVSKLEDIIRGLDYLREHYRDWGIDSIAFPPLGCGEGNLEWRVVGPTLFRYLKDLDIPVELYAPFGTPHQELTPDYLDVASDQAATFAVSAPDRVGASWTALVEILKRIEQQPYHWPIGRTSFQKIAYFATEAGIPTGLKYERGSYGPYSPDLKKGITRLVNNGLIKEERLGRMFAVRVGQTFADAARAYESTINKWDQQINSIADLFSRLDTRQAEVAATIHFAWRTTSKSAPSETDVLFEVEQWKQRRRPPLERPEIAKNIRALAMLGWIEVEADPDLPVPEEAFLDA